MTVRRRGNQSEPLATLPGVDVGRRLATPMSRATSKRRVKGPPASPTPWVAVVLGIDTATVSGWAINVCGKRVDSGEVHTHDTAGLDQVVQWAVNLGELADDIPVAMVLEQPWGGDVRIVTALGAASERWLRAWRDHGQAGHRVIRVMPSSWRAAVFGRARHGLRRDAIRELEQETASQIARRPVGSDEAPAILIARWGSHASKVGNSIGVKARRATLKQWSEGKR